MNELAYLTASLAGIGGRIKQRLEDFQVEEIPLYLPGGKGTHAYFLVHKAGVPTPVAVNRIARYMGVRPTEIGFAGLKDSQAITSQMMSLEYADAGKLQRFRDANVRISDVTSHTNKLRVGHLAGNCFVIRIRGVGAGELARAREILDILVQRGVPNYFGHQRFGARGDTADLGRAIVRRDLDEFVAIFLGRSMACDPPDCKAARDAFDTGYLDRALQRWPRHYTDQRKAVLAWKRTQNGHAVLAAIDKRFKRLFVSAFQSEIFNRVLTQRIGDIDRVQAGDLAMKEDSGGVFLVEDLAAEQPRAERFEISPTGPIVGPRCQMPQGTPGEMELEALTQEGVSPQDFVRLGSLNAKGSRRPLRFRIETPKLTAGTDGHGQYLELAFTAPSGCYATVVLRELLKTPDLERAGGEGPADTDD